MFYINSFNFIKQRHEKFIDILLKKFVSSYLKECLFPYPDEKIKQTSHSLMLMIHLSTYTEFLNLRSYDFQTKLKKESRDLSWECKD